MTQPTVTHRLTWNSDDDVAAYPSPSSLTFAAGSKVILYGVTRQNVGATVTPTPSGASITSVSLLGSPVVWGSGVENRLCVWEAEGTGSAGVITFTHGAAMWGFGGSVLDGTHPDGTPEVVGSPVPYQGSANPAGPISLPALQVDSVAIGGFAASSAVNYSNSGSFPVLGQAAGASPNGKLCTVAGSVNTITVATNYAEAGGGIGIELGVPGGVPGGEDPPPENNATLRDDIDFEAGDLSEVASSTNSPTVSAAAAYSSSYGVIIESIAGGDADTITTPTHAYSVGELMGARFRFSTVAPVSRLPFVYPRDGGDPPLDLAIATDGKLSLVNDVAGGEVKSAAALLADTWYGIEIYWTRAGAVIVRVDGDEVISVTGFDTAVAAPGSIDWEFAAWDQAAGGPVVHVDNIKTWNGATTTDRAFGAGAPGGGTVHLWHDPEQQALLNGGVG